MNREEYKVLLISDFTVDNLAGLLNNDKQFPRIKSVVAPFGQVDQVMINKDFDCWKENPDLAVVWTRPEAVSEAFNRLKDYQQVPLDEVLAEVDQVSSNLLNMAGGLKAVFVNTWVMPAYYRGLGMLDMKDGSGIANILMQMNLKLAENVKDAKDIYILNTQKWIELIGKKAFDPRLWYMGKIAFSNEVFMEAVKDIKAGLQGILGKAKKLIVLDLDETLWGGIVGDIGWQNINLGGHDPIGEAYVDFQ
ncbi:MAG: hypothetical protein KAV18_04935, partial [Candidatus Omnitrophica bacterium]|nr:hypothetical protein [Candidatus Omnitrophota bacterium]